MKAYLYVSTTLCLILFVVELHRVVTNLEKRRKSTEIVRIRQSDREHFMGSAVILIVFILILIWSS